MSDHKDDKREEDEENVKISDEGADDEVNGKSSDTNETADDSNNSYEDFKKENEKLLKELSEKEKEVLDHEDKFRRLMAEFDNYKRRSREEIDKSSDRGKIEILKRILPIVDEFELALVAANESTDKDLSKGVKMIYSNLMGTLNSLGLKEIDSERKYDPNIDEIIMTKDSEKEDDTILEVIKKGYRFNDYIVRPSAVIVSHQVKGMKIESDEDDKGNEGEYAEDESDKEESNKGEK